MATLPYFFFSYSHGDESEYLANFFRNLRDRVAFFRGIRESKDEVGFRDYDSIKPGDDWEHKISDALQDSKVLICIYTANFFSLEERQDFCGKEFAAFLDRNPDVQYDANDQFRVNGARNIVPILWVSEEVLNKLNRLPPHVVSSIHYAVDGGKGKLSDIYLARGVWWIAKRRPKSTYEDILDYFAKLIILESNNPLPPIKPAPPVAKLRNAFRDPPDGRAKAAAPAARDDGADLQKLLGPQNLLALEIRATAPGGAEWMPFSSSETLIGVVEAIANRAGLLIVRRAFDPRAQNFIADVSSVLAQATTNQCRPILFVHPECLAREEWRAALAELLKASWRGGVVVPAADKDSIALVEKFGAQLQPSKATEDSIVVRTVIGAQDAFRTAVISVIDEVLARIVNQGKVHQNVPGTQGRAALPRIANAQDAAQ
jgi:TIR domain